MSSTRQPVPSRAERFSYGPLEIDESAGVVRCNYDLDGRRLSETVTVGPGLDWDPAAREAARLLHLLAGVSYYKAGAAPEIDLGAVTVRPGEREFLRSFYLEGLGEFAFRNGLSLDDIEILGGMDERDPVPSTVPSGRPLIPFGGGIDSIVTVESMRELFSDCALFVVNRRGVERFAAIERSAEVTGLPVIRAERDVDAWILAPPPDHPVFNGHVPVTGVLSAVAVLCAVLHDRGAVVMSNEWSASQGNLEAGGRVVNHQYSKSEAFETGFRRVLRSALEPAPDYFSFLRPFSELWVARRFAALGRYHRVVHSCNRAFHLDPARRLDHWCGECDKCCFIDLILAPFVPAPELRTLFGGVEPLERPQLLDRFRALLALGDARKPFECVGDAGECRAAAALAVEREDRAGNALLIELMSELGPEADAARGAADSLMAPLGPHHLPDAVASAALG